MTIRNLEFAFAPRSVALIGASPEAGSVGATIVANLQGGGFEGPVYLVNPGHRSIGGEKCYRDVASLPAAPDLAVVATPADTLPGIVSELGACGVHAAVVVTAGLSKDERQAMLDAAKPHCLRIIGPNGLGLWLPNIGLNASFGHVPAKPGRLALLSQSGALIGGILDWAISRDIGFSAIVSMGDMADVDVGDLLDFLAADISTRAILLYLESVPARRKFMSAARSAARAKPVIVIKSGRYAASAKAAATHTGALAGADNVVDAAFRRAGLLRVDELEEMFNAAEALTHLRPLSGDRLSILTNGGGAGVLAVDRLMSLGGRLAPLGETEKEALGRILPANWSAANPVDIIGDANAARYAAAMDIMLDGEESDALLVMNCPTALTSSLDAAKAVIDTIEARRARGHVKPVLCTWLGADGAREARNLFARSGIPSYESPDDAVRAFNQLRQYTSAQEELTRVPANRGDGEVAPMDEERTRDIFRSAAKSGRDMLTETEAKSVLFACGIPTVPTEVAESPDDVEHASARLLQDHAAVVIKIYSEDISHKSDVGGVVLGLKTPQAARQAAEEIIARVREQRSDARIQGFAVQPMIERPGAYELITGVMEDALFGPVILFGAGGTSTEIVADTAVALPPLDGKFTRDMMERTRIYKLLEGYRNQPPADLAAIENCLIRLSQLIVACPAVMEIDINPLLADEKGVIALDARIRIDPAGVEKPGPNPRLALRPYPAHWATQTTMQAGMTVLIRPVRPADEHLYGAFFSALSAEDIRFRFLAPKKEFSHAFIARFTQIDYNRAMAFVALDPEERELLGVARLSANPDYESAEYAIVVRSDLKGQGLGWALMSHLIDYARSEGLKELYGDVLRANTGMLSMCRELGFRIRPSEDDPAASHVTLDLRQAAETA